MAHYVSNKDLKLITPRKEVKARNYQLNSGQTLFIGGLGRFDFIKGDKETFVCYFSNEVPIHRTKLENVDNLYENNIGNLLSQPNKDTYEKLADMIDNTYKISHVLSDNDFPRHTWFSFYIITLVSSKI